MSENQKPRRKITPQIGVKAAADLVAGLDTETRERIMRSLAEKDAKLAGEIRKQMVIFDDLIPLARAKDGAIGWILHQVPRERWALALRGVSEELMTAILSNMTSRAAKELQEQIDTLGPQPKSKVQEAQREILAALNRLKQQGGR